MAASFWGDFPSTVYWRNPLVLKTAYDASSSPAEATQTDLSETAPSETAPDQPDKERVRILIYGSRRAVERTIVQLHLLRYVDKNCWNPIAPIPENGISITPAEAETYSFLSRELHIE